MTFDQILQVGQLVTTIVVVPMLKAVFDINSRLSKIEGYLQRESSK